MHDTPRIVRYDQAVEEPPSEAITERLRAFAQNATEHLASTVGSARSAFAEGFLPTVASRIRELAALIVRFIGALRARLDEKPRRKQVPRSQAARAHLKNTRRGGRRYLVLAAMVAGIVAAGWGIYLWAAGSAADASVDAELDAAERAIPSSQLAEVEAPTPEPAAEVAPAAPIAVQGAPLPPESVRGSAFGADAVAGGEKYVLRMSNPVVEMDGIVEEDGFSVTIPGSLSLSRAGPIASAHPDVEHASILNRGDFSELTIRFVPGREPTYRVEARGPAIEITIAR